MSSEGDTSTQRSAKEPNLDCYAVLGVHPNAEDVVIRAAFKALAQRYHPDRFSGSKEEAHRRMSDLTHAYETLCDPVRRGKYDRRRRLKAHSASLHLRDARRDVAPRVAATSPVTAAARQRRYRQAVGALVGAVVVLSAFNLYQYSGRVKSWVSSAATPAPSGTTPRGAAEVPIPIVTGVSIEPAPELPPVRPRSVQPATPGATGTPGTTTRAITAGTTSGESPSASAAAALGVPAITPVARTPPRPAAVDPPRLPAAAPAVAPPVQAALPARREIPIAPAKSEVAPQTPAPSEEPGNSAPCSDAVIALGLCKPNATAKAQ